MLSQDTIDQCINAVDDRYKNKPGPHFDAQVFNEHPEYGQINAVASAGSLDVLGYELVLCISPKDPVVGLSISGDMMKHLARTFVVMANDEKFEEKIILIDDLAYLTVKTEHHIVKLNLVSSEKILEKHGEEMYGRIMAKYLRLAVGLHKRGDFPWQMLTIADVMPLLNGSRYLQ